MRINAIPLAALFMALFSFITPAAAQSEAGKIIEVIGLQAHPSDVDIGNATVWSRINVDPYQGDVTQASGILSRKTDIRPHERAEAWAMRIRGECFAYQLKPGDVTRTTFGKNRTMLAEVGFTGMAEVCIIRADGTAVVFPRDCANIGDAMAIVRRATPPPAVTYVPPVSTGVTITTTMTAAESRSNQGVVFGGTIAPRYAGGNTTITNTSTSSARATAVVNQATVVGPACPGTCPSSPSPND